MRLTIAAIGKLKAGPEKLLAEDYATRIPALGKKAGITSLAIKDWAESQKPDAAQRMAEEQAQLFAERGHRVRIYTPFGELIPGMAYLVRRLLENTSNDSFLRHAYDTSVSIEELLRRPADAAPAAAGSRA